MEEKKVKKNAGYRAGELFAWIIMISLGAIVLTGAAAVCYRVWSWILF